MAQLLKLDWTLVKKWVDKVMGNNKWPSIYRLQ